MRKLLFVSNQYFPNVVGGAEISVQTLVEELARRGFEVSVVSLSSDTKDSSDVVNGVRVRRLAVRNLYAPFQASQPAWKRAVWHTLDSYNPAMARRFSAILDEDRPDWVSAHNLGGFSVSVWSAVKARGIGLSQMLHDYYLVCPRTTMYWRAQNCQTPCLTCRAYGIPRRLTSGLPDVVLGVSRFVLQRHLALGYFPGVRSGVVYNGRPWQKPGARAPRGAGAPLRLGFIGRVTSEKGIETLLGALSRLPRERFALSVAGRAVDVRYLASLQQRYPVPEVRYLGFIEPGQLYADIDLLVVPSLWEEPFGSVVVEALGHGVPVLASDAGGLPEILEGSGCGWVFPGGDVEALTRKLDALWHDWPDTDELCARACETRARFTPERQADAFLALIDPRAAPAPL